MKRDPIDVPEWIWGGIWVAAFVVALITKPLFIAVILTAIIAFGLFRKRS